MKQGFRNLGGFFPKAFLWCEFSCHPAAEMTQWTGLALPEYYLVSVCVFL